MAKAAGSVVENTHGIDPADRPDAALMVRWVELALMLVLLAVRSGLAQEQKAAVATGAMVSAVVSGTNLRVEAGGRAASAVVGSNDPASGYKIKVFLTPYGAGIWWLTLTDYRWQPLGTEPYAVLRNRLADGTPNYLYHLAARRIWINDQAVWVGDAGWELVESDRLSFAEYALVVRDAEDRPVLEIRRRFEVQPGSYEVLCRQSLRNLSGQSIRVVWEQNALGDIVPDEGSYMGDRRELMAGYFNLSYDPARQHIYTDRTQVMRQKVMEKAAYWPVDHLPEKHELVWLAMVNRYFAVAVHPAVPMGVRAIRPLDIPPLVQWFEEKVGVEVQGAAVDKQDRRSLALILKSRPIELEAGKTASLDVALYAGPRSPVLFRQQPYEALGFGGLVVYNLGGLCAFCTFQWLAKLLLVILRAIYFVLRDWGLAIIALVLLVRGLLHPITRRSQINMTKMQKQMAALQPEIEKLKKKFANDQTRLQQETMRLYREKGINPLNVLGCLPMFLQMPIWIALYAMLYYAIELRHQPAFYGLFQWMSAGRWHFLADLSSPDFFIKFPGDGITVNLLLFRPTFAGIHLLPILMAVVFYVQQKITTPPPTSEQAAQQQRIMMWMTLLFPLMLYSAPSGLNLYILASTAAGIADSWLVKQHIKKEEEAGTLFVPKKPRPGSFMDRLMKLVEERQKMLGQADRLPRRKE